MLRNPCPGSGHSANISTSASGAWPPLLPRVTFWPPPPLGAANVEQAAPPPHTASRALATIPRCRRRLAQLLRRIPTSPASSQHRSSGRTRRGIAPRISMQTSRSGNARHSSKRAVRVSAQSPAPAGGPTAAVLCCPAATAAPHGGGAPGLREAVSANLPRRPCNSAANDTAAAEKAPSVKIRSPEGALLPHSAAAPSSASFATACSSRSEIKRIAAARHASVTTGFAAGPGTKTSSGTAADSSSWGRSLAHVATARPPPLAETGILRTAESALPSRRSAVRPPSRQRNYCPFSSAVPGRNCCASG